MGGKGDEALGRWLIVGHNIAISVGYAQVGWKQSLGI